VEQRLSDTERRERRPAPNLDRADDFDDEAELLERSAPH